MTTTLSRKIRIPAKAVLSPLDQHGTDVAELVAVPGMTLSYLHPQHDPAINVEHYNCPALPEPLVEVLTSVSRELSHTSHPSLTIGVTLDATGPLLTISLLRGKFFAALMRQANVLALALHRICPEELALAVVESNQTAQDLAEHEAGEPQCCDAGGACPCHRRRPSGEPCEVCTGQVVQAHHDALTGYLVLIARHITIADADQLIALGHAAHLEAAS